MSGELVRKDSIQELCGHRRRALELYALGRKMLEQARLAHARATIGNASISGIDKILFDYSSIAPEKPFTDKVQRAIDRDMWRAFVVNTPLGSLMDVKERKIFEDSLNGEEIPEATEDNVEITLRRLAGDADMIFRRGLVNSFQGLNRDYRSHDGFKLGDRIILTNVVVYEKNCDWMRSGYRMEEQLRDVDRVMYVLDGKPAPEYQGGITAALRTAIQNWKSGGAMECETEYWRLKFHKNGNGHLYPKRPDLIEKANKLIAEHYGATVGVGPDGATKNYQTPTNRDHWDEGFFPTPEAVVERVMEWADIRSGQKVLEPSAGTGNLAMPIAEIPGVYLSCYEINDCRCNLLSQSLKDKAIIYNIDFLDSDKDKRFDRIVMNPPFGQQQDIVHVIEAFYRLAPGGRLVSVMSPAFQTRDTPLAQRLREIVDQYGFVEKLPEGSFKASGTNVNTVIVVLDRFDKTALAA